MNRTELERLDRDDLIARAELAGVTRARILTRPELVDELLLRSAGDTVSKQKARGFFGVARDLLASVVERGFHLPDAAERIRTLGAPPEPHHRAPAALPTVTLAEIYAAQGHRERAIDTLEGVMVREPDHAAARALLTQLHDSTYPLPAPPLPPEEEEGLPPAASASDEEAEKKADEAVAEPTHMLDDAPLPMRYDVDECVAIPVDPRTLYVYWEIRDRTLEFARASRQAGAIVLRVAVIEPTWDGPQSSVRDHEVSGAVGDFFVRDLPAGCVVRAAIGWKDGDTFLPISHSPALETPPGGPSPLVADVLVRWTPKGTFRVAAADPDAASIERALGRVRREMAQARQDGFSGLGSPPWGGQPSPLRGSSQEMIR